MINVGLADDDALVRHTLTDLLATTEDVRIVWSARDGEEALAALQAPDNPVEVLLLDIQMPRLDGIALAEALHEDRPELAILILTTFVADAILDRALAAGVRGFIAKEDPVSALATTIRHVAAGNMVLSPTSSAIISRRQTNDGDVAPHLLQADRPPPGSERGDRQDARVHSHRQTGRARPRGRRCPRSEKPTCLTFVRPVRSIDR